MKKLKAVIFYLDEKLANTWPYSAIAAVWAQTESGRLIGLNPISHFTVQKVLPTCYTRKFKSNL